MRSSVTLESSPTSRCRFFYPLKSNIRLDRLFCGPWMAKDTSQSFENLCGRVSEITSRITANHWRYVHTSCNPADLVSRGIRPSELLQSKLWWNGPPWLSLSPAHWPRRPDVDRKDSLPDLKPAVLIVQPTPDKFGLSCSNFTRLCRVTAWIYRFLKRTRGRHKFKTTYLTVSELRVAKTLSCE